MFHLPMDVIWLEIYLLKLTDFQKATSELGLKSWSEDVSTEKAAETLESILSIQLFAAAEAIVESNLDIVSSL